LEELPTSKMRAAVMMNRSPASTLLMGLRKIISKQSVPPDPPSMTLDSTVGFVTLCRGADLGG
jgi:hypothetical protein